MPAALKRALAQYSHSQRLESSFTSVIASESNGFLGILAHVHALNFKRQTALAIHARAELPK